MTGTTHPINLTADALREAIRTRDSDTLAALYDPEATVEIVDAERPPSEPLRLQGAAAVGEHLHGIYSRDMRHEVDIVSLTGDALGYLVRCAYPDGTRVLCSSMATLREGRIAREVVVQAWDS
jgi:hypothetical protein